MSQLPNQPYYVDNFFTNSNQQTYDGSCIGGDFAQGTQSATQVWNVDKDGLDGFIANCLGWSSYDKTRGGGPNDGDGDNPAPAGANNTNLNRKLPAKHPSGFGLYASRVSNIQGIASTGMTNVEGNPQPSWKAYRVTVQFEAPLYQILDDSRISKGDEWKRYVIWNMEPTVEFIQLHTGGVLEYASNPPVPNLDTANRSIPGQYGRTIRLVKKKITALWVQVPDAGLFGVDGSTTGLYSAHLDEGMGKVNRDDYMGYPAGTLRFDGWKPTPRTIPIPVSYVNGLSTPLAWDVELSFSFFDPIRDSNYAYPGDGVPFLPASLGRGHNLVPHPTRIYWYPAYRVGSSGEGQLVGRYQEYDFRLLFCLN